MRLLPALTLTAAAIVVMTLSACSKPEVAPEAVRAVRTQTIGVDSATGAHEFAGEVRARIESRLGFRVGGKLISRSAELGQAVKAGKVLAQLDPQDLKQAQDAAKASLAAAQANADQATAEIKRFRELRAQGFISATELERREVAFQLALAQRDQAKAQATVQSNQAAYAALTADAAGVITEVLVDPGAVLAAGTPVLRLARDGARDVVFSVPEDQVEWLRSQLGKTGALKVRLWASPTAASEPLPATLRELAAAADPATRSFLAKADVGAAPVRLGQTATVLVDWPVRTSVVRLPLSAVTQLQGKTSVWVLDKATMKVSPQAVQVQGAEGNAVVVSSGLKPGQVVVTAGVHVLTPGLTVKLYDEPGAASPAPVAKPASATAQH